MSQHDNQVRPVPNLIHVFLNRLNHRQRVPRTSDIRRQIVAHQIAHHRADHRHANPIHLLDKVRVPRQQLAAIVHNVRGHCGKLGNLKELEDCLPAVVELMIAQRGHLNAQLVRHLINRYTAEDRRHRRSLHQVARIHHNARLAPRGLPANHRRKLGKAAQVPRIRQEPRMKIVAMKNG